MNTQTPHHNHDAAGVDTANASAHAPMDAKVAGASLQMRLKSRVNWFLWPIAALVILHRTWALPQNPGSTDDFTTVWRAVERFAAGMPVYTENYLEVDPHYLYNPGATFLLSPIAYLGTYDISRLAFVIVQSASIVLGLAILLRWIGVQRGSWIFPATLIIAFHTEGVTNTLNFTNVNGSLFLVVCAFLYLLTSHGEGPKKTRANHIIAGVLIGLGLTIKPVLAPLLFIPFVRKNFGAVISAIAVAVLTNIIGILMMVQPRDYLTIVVPYLKVARDYFNSSLPGQLVWFGAPSALILLWQIFFGVFVLIALVLLLRWVTRDEVFWMATTTGLLMSGAFFLSSLGQQYYSIMLLPMVLTILRPLLGQKDQLGMYAHTVMLNWPAGLAAALVLFNGSWTIGSAPLVTSWFNTAISTFGWGLLILVICGHMIHLTITDIKSGRSFTSGFSWAKMWLTRKPNQHEADNSSSLGSPTSVSVND